MKNSKLKWILILFITASMAAQNPHDFDKEIEKFNQISFTEGIDLTVFTGSSTIRLWKNLEEDCKQSKLVNTGFGGSQMSDLLYFIDQTVLRFKPKTVYIYEGDNDIAAGKKPDAIIKTAQQVVDKILSSDSETKIVFISAKPSPSRWSFKSEYLSFNALLKKYCESHEQLSYIDVWNPMLNDHGRPAPQIFVSDSLHMNRQGYLLWKGIICKSNNP